jgi:hypothetical protein
MIGTVINNYRIVGVLDESGGMGVVYRAEHVSMGQRAVIKLLWPHVSRDKSGVARFLNEARAAAAIDDPGIVKIFDQGSLPDGSAYITMEHLPGESLRARLSREGPLPPAMALTFLRQAARAVGAAHRRGIVHRDLKPENLFLCPDPELPGGTRVKVLDFGIAKLAEGGSGVVTQTGTSMGTPAYMAPEQWWSARDVDGRTDVYALGCVLHEMLTGRAPFSGPSLPEYMDQHRFHAPPFTGVPAFDAVIQRALAKTAAERFATVDELIAALPGGATASLPPQAATPAAVARPTPGPLDPGGPTERVARGRSRAPIVLAALALAGGGAVAGVLLSRRDPSPPLVEKGPAPAPAAAAPATPDATAPITPDASSPAVTPPEVADAAAAPEACRPVELPPDRAALAPVLGKPVLQRGRDLIVGFSLDDVAPRPEKVGAGGITAGDRSLSGLGECSDSPDGDAASAGAALEHEASGLRVEVTAVEPAGRSGRGWKGVRCAYRVTDRARPALHADLGLDVVPAFNALTGLLRVDDVVYATLQFNGYAKEIGGEGNLVVAVDLCSHRVLWRSADLVSNAAILVHGDALITGYGFTSEPDSLTVLDRFTGSVVQRLTLPRSPDELRLADGALFVRLYDGYARIPLR